MLEKLGLGHLVINMLLTWTDKAYQRNKLDTAYHQQTMPLSAGSVKQCINKKERKHLFHLELLQP